ncbi:Regulatory protein RecX [Nocardia sp. RB20]|uniref:Regulatory protein RecX n=1 Tax=Nocardia macrotermitis TaxID=2585198 RepID=A0A7K0CZJ9_9NOCA|nr:Regulatory protein RecX [Nocardia macrotermitis]
MRLLTDRARSRAELADKLAEKGFASAVVERVLDRLAEVGLIDDAAFAEQWVHSRHTYSGKGKKVLAQELRRKGIAPDVAAPALESISTDDEHTRATDLVHRKLRTLPADLDRDKATSRLVGMLARKGYDPSTAYAVVKAAVAEADLPTPPRPERPGSTLRRPEPPARTTLDDNTTRAMPFGRRTTDNDHSADRDARRHRAARSERDAQLDRDARRDHDAWHDDDIRHDRDDAADSRTSVADAFADTHAASDTDPDDAAITLIHRKLRTSARNLDRDKLIRRLVGMLARRGYNQSRAYALVKAELAVADLD